LRRCEAEHAAQPSEEHPQDLPRRAPRACGSSLGFDNEKGSVADGMVACIEDTAIPVCMVGLLYALPTTQLTRRLERGGRPLDGDQMAATNKCLAQK